MPIAVLKLFAVQGTLNDSNWHCPCLKDKKQNWRGHFSEVSAMSYTAERSPNFDATDQYVWWIQDTLIRKIKLLPHQDITWNAKQMLTHVWNRVQSHTNLEGFF